MAINKKLIHFSKGENYDTQKANGNILDSSICFIQDRKTIITHGTEYKTVNWGKLEPESPYEWIDLGLPSGTLWADKNVGAEKPEDYGLYFAWGETEGYSGITAKKGFYWGDYKFSSGQTSSTSMSFKGVTKYNSKSASGTVDNLYTLELVDDAAYVSDNTCRMPTKADLQELIDNTTSSWETLNGVDGRRFTGSNGNSIFSPAAGFYDSGTDDIGTSGTLWSNSPYESDPKFAWGLSIYLDDVGVYYQFRRNGFSIRAVK